MRVIDLSTLSLVGGSGIAEAKQVIWSADGTSVSVNAPVSVGTEFLQDGSSGLATSGKTLFTLSSNWPPSLQFALEVTMSSTSSSYTVSGALWDTTNNAVVNNTATSTSSTSMTVIRSGKFTLTPNHSYGITVYDSGSTQINISDASLIIFP